MMHLLLAMLLTGAPAKQAVAIESAYADEIRAAIDDTKSVHAVPEALVRAVILTESAFNPKAQSACGAVGLMQVMPFNATKLGLENEKQLWEPRLNILAGVRLLAALLHHYEGDVISALVAYNSGPKRKLAPVPSNGETPAYVIRILKHWKKFDPTLAVSERPNR